MADQQFLASFGVDIDESGVSRLQKILSENRTLAESLSSAFDTASWSVKAFRESISEDFPTLFSGSGYGNVTENLFGEYAGLKIGLNMTEPKKEIAAFTENAKKPISLTANASSIVSAARTAMESVRSLFSETFTLNVRAETNTDRKSEEPSSRQDSRNREETGSAFLRMSSGGRFSRLTTDMGSWDRMFIAEITATQDEMNQYGWAGDIVFMQYIPKSEQYYSGAASGTAVSSTTSTRKTQNNSSTKKNTGTKAAVTSATAGVTAVLSRAGITTGAGGGALNFIIAK